MVACAAAWFVIGLAAGVALGRRAEASGWRLAADLFQVHKSGGHVYLVFREDRPGHAFFPRDCALCHRPLEVEEPAGGVVQ